MGNADTPLRCFLAQLAFCLFLCVSFEVLAQPAARLPRIGAVTAGPWGSFSTHRAFMAGMREHGYVEGRDFVMEVRDMEGKAERYFSSNAELAHVPVDVLLVSVCGLPLHAARQATHTIPIVVATCNDDLVDSGIINSMQRPGSNITGLSKLTPELAPKRLSLLKQILPSLSQVAVLWNPGYSDFKADWRELKAAAQRIGITLHSYEFRQIGELDGAFNSMRHDHVEAMIMFSDVLTFIYAKEFAERASASGLPAIYALREVPDAGGLMSYGPNIPNMYRRSADYVVRILQGANPADLPIEQPTRFEFVVNVKTATALGIKIPQSVLVQADERIE
jgi:putative ABC transport system substrate-binding protein